jgi:hypothetical protein
LFGHDLVSALQSTLSNGIKSLRPDPIGVLGDQSKLD